MERIKVKSSNVSSIGFQHGILEIEFKNKPVYHYKNVPESIFLRMLRTNSKGKFLKLHVENKFKHQKIR